MTCSKEGDAIETINDDNEATESKEESGVGSDYDMSSWCCNCETPGLGPEDHSTMCSLHACWEFRNGWYVWDEDSLELIDVVEAIDSGLLYGNGNTYSHSDTTIRSRSDRVDDYDDDDVRYKNWWDNDDYEGITSSTVTTTTTSYRYKCSHYQQPFKLPSGVEVYASTYHRDRLDDPLPDLGIYLDGIWMPDCVAFHLGCPDYGIPTVPVNGVLYVAREGISAAANGKRVEIGCIGGHGRTGLMLAIMSLLSMRVPDAQKAIDRVHDDYCIEAIESPEQEWYIEGIANQLQGKPWPPKPKPKEYPKWVKDEAGVWYKIPHEGADPEPLYIPKKEPVATAVAAKKATSEKGSAGKPWSDPYYPANNKTTAATNNIKDFVAKLDDPKPPLDLVKKKAELLAEKERKEAESILCPKKEEPSEGTA